MAIKVSLEDHTGNVSRSAKLAETAPVSKLIPAIITALNLPITEGDGRTISYHLAHNNRLLDGEETLLSSHVVDGDIIAVVPVLSAGGYDPASDTPVVSSPTTLIAPPSTGHDDFERLNALIGELASTIQGQDTEKLIANIRAELKTSIESQSIPIIIAAAEREPIPLVRADRLHIIEEYRDEQNKWFAIAWAFIGATFGIIVNWATGEGLVITKISLVLIGVFIILAILAWLSAYRFQKRADSYKRYILYGEPPSQKEVPSSQ